MARLTKTVLLAAVLALTLSACDDAGEPGYCVGHPNNSSVCGN